MPVKVRAYSGYKAEERPMSFFLGDREHKVKEIMCATHEERAGRRVRSFKVLTEEKEVYRLYYAEEEDQWYLEPA